jgi:hypothetical protein
MASITSHQHEFQDDKLRLLRHDNSKYYYITKSLKPLLGGSNTIAEPLSICRKDLHHRRLQGSTGIHNFLGVLLMLLQLRPKS